jgi:HSP20 family protein
MSLVRFTRRTPRLATEALAPFASFNDMENRMRSFAESVFANPFDGNASNEVLGWMPPMEITETPAELALTAELPGLEKKDIEISVDDGVLTLRGEKTDERKEDDAETKYHLWERSYGTFRRTFTLPRTVDASKIVAEFEKGVLKIRMPKAAEETVKGRKIEITAK